MAEDLHTEYKSEFSDKIAKSVVAFSNGDGGVILIGIDDDGNIIGLHNADETALKCVGMLHDDIRPDVTPTTSVDVIKMDGKDIIEIIVQEGTSKPYYLRQKGMRAEGVYIRRGPSSTPATDEQFNQMIRRARSKEYESLRSFRQDLTFTYAENVFHRSGLAFDDAHMNMLGMMDQDGYTNLGFLLSDQCDFQMKAAVFMDEHRTGFIDRQEISGSLLRQYDDAMMFIRRHTTVSSEIVGTKRNDHYDFPTEAVREIVLNAIIHRDYTSSGTTLISMYGDRLEIASPGTIMEDISREDMFKGVSFPRNRKLSEVFYRLGLVEAYGSGIPRIMGIYSDSERHPEFDITPAVFRVTIYSKNGFKDISLKKGDVLTRSDIEKRMGVSKSKATILINDMLDEKRIERIGSGKATKYLVL